jgi:hypothetical protein
MPRDWWAGNQGAATTGYGTFDARPAAREAPDVLEELITTDDDGPQTFGGGTNEEQINQQNQTHYANQMRQLQMQLVDLQLQLSREQPGSFGYNGKLDQIRSTQAKMQQMQIQMGS